MPKKISTLNPGNLVKLNEAGNPIQFIFLEYNHYGKNEVTLLQRCAYNKHCLHDDSAFTFDYYKYLDYHCSSVYVQLLDPIVRACLVPVEIKRKIYRNSLTGSSKIVNYNRSCFALSSTEYGSWSNSEGTKFKYFSTNSSRIAENRESDVYDQSSVEYSTRSSYTDNGNTYSYGIDVYGSHEYYSTNDTSDNFFEYTRIALTLSSDIMLSDSVDSDNCYNIVSVPAAENYQKVNGIWMKMV